jgi:hypothetical protein
MDAKVDFFSRQGNYEARIYKLQDTIHHSNEIQIQKLQRELRSPLVMGLGDLPGATPTAESASLCWKLCQTLEAALTEVAWNLEQLVLVILLDCVFLLTFFNILVLSRLPQTEQPPENHKSSSVNSQILP